MDNAIGKLGAYCPEIGDLVSRENGVRFAVITKGNSQPCGTENYPLTQFVLHSPKIETKRPIIASGMLNQLSHPNNGIIPKSIPHMARIPNILPKVFITYIFH